MFRLKLLAAALTVCSLCSSVTFAEIVELDFQGSAGFGLAPENHGLSTSATGFEIGEGLTYDTSSRTLSLLFGFEDLTGGLIDAAGGIHIHDAGPVDPFNTNGGIEFFLNTDGANVPFGSNSGTIDLDITLSEAQEAELFNNQYYVNIHTGGFNAGEL